MDAYDRGKPFTFELTWRNGLTETFEAHQVSYHTGPGLFGKPDRVEFHGEFDGHWTLVLSAPMSEVLTIRNTGLTAPGAFMLGGDQS